MFLYFEKQTDLAQRQKKTDDEWQTQSVYGTVKSVDAAAKNVVIAARGGSGPPKDVTLDATGQVEYQRFSLDSGKMPSRVPLDLTLDSGGRSKSRLLGQKNADQTEIKLEAIQSATLKSLPVTVRSVDTAGGTIMATDLTSKKPITISVKPDTQLKRLDDATALLMARRLNPTFQSMTGWAAMLAEVRAGNWSRAQRSRLAVDRLAGFADGGRSGRWWPRGTPQCRPRQTAGSAAHHRAGGFKGRRARGGYRRSFERYGQAHSHQRSCGRRPDSPGSPAKGSRSASR